MGTHNIGFLGEAILMSTQNIAFYEDLTKIIGQLSSNMHLFSSSEKKCLLQWISGISNNWLLTNT